MAVPALVRPVAPGGEQKAPGVTASATAVVVGAAVVEVGDEVESGAVDDDVVEATVTGSEAFHYQLDGEALDPVNELQLEHRPDAIRLVVPTGDAPD